MIQFIRINEDGSETHIPVDNFPVDLVLPEPTQQLPKSKTWTVPKAVDWFITNEPLEIYIGIKGEKVKEDKGIMLNYEDGSKVLLPDADKEKAIAYIDRVIYLLKEAMEELE